MKPNTQQMDSLKNYTFKIPETATLSQLIQMLNLLELNVQKDHISYDLIKEFGWKLTPKDESFK